MNSNHHAHNTTDPAPSTINQEQPNHVSVEITPNPETLKFLVGRDVSPERSFDFTNIQEAASVSPLAVELLNHTGVERVFLGRQFVSVTKRNHMTWDALQDKLQQNISAYLDSGAPMLLENSVSDAGNEVVCDPQDADLVKKIEELINTRVRPVIDQDGGDIVFRGFDRGIVYMELRGACVGCPAASATLKMGIENLLRFYIHEVVEVRAIG